MSRSANAKQSALTRRLSGNKKSKDKPRGQSGTHRLKQLNHESAKIEDIGVVKTQKRGWFSRLFGK